MAAASWVIQDGNLTLISANGEVVRPSASDVFGVAFHQVADIAGLSVPSPLEALPEISFSRLPAPVALRVQGSLPGGLRAEIGVVTDAGFVAIEQDRDSIISQGRWYPIASDDLLATRQWLLDREIGLGIAITLGHIVLLRQAVDAPFQLFDETSIEPKSVAQTAGKSAPEVSGLRAVLYAYQREGVGFLRVIADQNIGCLLADEMGLGKTLQVIALLLVEKEGGRSANLVVAPATLLENWRREVVQFAPTLKVLVHAGSTRAGISSRLAQFDVVITSYDTVVRDGPMFQSLPWNVVALDEAQSIKNPSAQRTAAVKKLRRRVSIAITGTPVENRLDDLWSICDFSLPGLLGDIGSFRQEFVDQVGDAERLSTIVAPIILRRRISEVAADLPSFIEIPEALQMSHKLAVAYEAVRNDIRAEYGSAANMVAITKLRQVCAHPRLVAAWATDLVDAMPKYQRLLELLSQVSDNGEKALIFCAYQEMTDLLVADLKLRWPNCFVADIDGRTPVNDRQPTVDQFSLQKGFGILVLNPKAAGVGLNITAANHVIHYTPEWNPAVTDQASRRAYRRKQELPVTVHHLYFVDTVEEVMMERTTFKRSLAGHAVTGHAGNVSSADILRALEISPLATAELQEQ